MKATPLAVLFTPESSAAGFSAAGSSPALSALAQHSSLLSANFLPHLSFHRALPWLIWSNILADSLIALSFIVIFITLFWLGSRIRRIPGGRSYLWVCAALGSFILASGATHVMSTVTMWLPVYRFSVTIKVACAIASITTAYLLSTRVSGIAHRIERLVDLLACEHQQAEALRRSEALLDRTNHVAGIGGWELDLVTQQVNWSAETARLHRMPLDFRPTLEEGIHFFAPEFRQTVIDALEKGMAGGPPWDLELQILRRDGTRVWTRVLGEVEFLDGKPVKLFGSLQDKTREFEQRDALRKTEFLLDRINTISGMGGWEVDLATNEVTWYAQTARIHALPPGYKPTLEKSIDYFAPECHSQVRAMMATAISGGGGWDVELTLIRADGARRRVRHLGEVELLDGKPVKLFGSLQDITVENDRREALRKSQAFLDRTNRIAGVGGWEIDIATGAITWSAETYRIHALPQSFQPTLEAGLSFFAPASRPIIAAAVERAFKTGESWDLELQLVRADDKHTWVRTVGSVESKDGRPIRIVGAIQDKTTQIQTRLALTIANERVTLATDSGGIAIWDWDLASNHFICDPWMFRIYGFAPVAGPTPMSLWAGKYHPEDRPLVLSALMDAIEDRQPYDMEFRVVWADGTTHIVKATGQVIRDENGKPLRMIGTNRDVTDARNLAAELVAQHELLRVTLLSIGEAVVSEDVARNIVWMNGAAERMTGWNAADASGRLVTDVFHIVYDASRLPVAIHTDPEVASIRRILADEMVLLLSRDGVERNIECCATPIHDNRGAFVGGVLVLRDVTEQVRLARESQQITKLQIDLKLKDEFLSHVSHELRSPLTSVYSFTSIIADNLAGDTTAEQQQYLQIVLKNVLQLQSMIEDLLTVTQSKEGGKLTIEFQNVPVAAAILDAIDTAHPTTVSKNIAITTGDLARLPDAWSDPTRLRQIMIILLDNAIKFTPDGGKVIVRVTEEYPMLSFEVEDNGCGIPLDQRARIFEKLYQVLGPDHADTSQAGRIGLGLGLHIARDLIRRQGGNIHVKGAPEKGSIFHFTLAIAEAETDANSQNRFAAWRSRSDLPESLNAQLNPAA